MKNNKSNKNTNNGKDNNDNNNSNTILIAEVMRMIRSMITLRITIKA